MTSMRYLFLIAVSIITFSLVGQVTQQPLLSNPVTTGNNGSLLTNLPAGQLTGTMPTNCIPANVNGNSITNLTGTNINFNLVRTNFTLGQLYTNTTGNMIGVSATLTITTAAILGKSEAQLQVTGLVTNVISIPTVLLGLAASYQNGLNAFVPSGSVYSFVNTSTGSGNGVSLILGQILVY